MVTLAILALLLAIGVPSMQGFLASRQAQAQADTFASALRYARSEALKRSQRVTMCLSGNPDDPQPTCDAAGADWNTGWVVYVNFNNSTNPAPPNLIVNVQQSMAGTAQITGRNGAAPPRVSFTFTGDGLSIGDNGSFEIKSHGGDQKSCVVLASTGRVRTEKNACPQPT